MKKQLAKIFDEILREIEKNPELRERIGRILNPETEQGQDAEPTRRPRNKRPPGVVDPYHEYESGEAQLQLKLEPLTVDELKDVISEYALDSSRRALKWKSRERLIELIVTTVSSRMQKGDAFRK